MPPALMHKLADKVLGLMEAGLAQQDFLAAPHPTLADIACYAYIAHAPEGGVALEAWPQVRAWIARVQALPHFVPMPDKEP
jgi:glutathione S-transferase